MSNTHIFRLSAALLAALFIFFGGCTAPDSAVSGPAQTGDVQTVPPSTQEPAPSDGFAANLPAGPAPVTPSPAVTPEVTPTPSPTPSAPSTPSPTPSASPDWVFVPPGAVAEGEPVEESWFSDAVFVGDSRTDGLRLYSGIKSADFICHQGLSVFTIGDKECIKLDGKKVTALEALAKQQYAKVYLMLGVNELGYPTESYRNAYTKLVREIKEIQPNAVIYLQTLPPVNEPLARSKGISKAITNEKLIAFNQIIADIAESEGTALVAVDELFWTEQGELAEENTTDGVHFARKGYEAWFEYLKSHTGTTGSAEPDPSASPEPSPSEDPALSDPDVSAGPSPSEEPPLSDPDVSAEPSASPEPEPSASEGADQTAANAGEPAQG